MEIEVPLVYDKEDFWALNRLNQSRAKLMIIVASFVLYAAMRIVRCMNNGWEVEILDFVMITVFIAFFFLYFASPMLAYRMQKKRGMKEGFLLFTDEKYYARVLAESFENKTENSYNSFAKVLEGRRHILLYTNNSTGTYILKKAMIQPQDLLQLREKLQGLLGKNYKIINR